MTWVATAIIGGAVLSTIGTSIASHSASNAATQAAAVQSDAAVQAAQLQKGIYDQTRNDLLPFQNVGRGATSFVNGLVPGGLGTNTPAQPTSGAPATGGTPQLSGYDENGQPVYTNVGGSLTASTDGTIPVNAGGAPASGSSPFLNAQVANIPQLGGLTQPVLQSFLPGAGTNPLQSALYSYVNGASTTPNPLLSATNNSVLGGSGSPNAALNNLTSFIPGSANANPATSGVTNSLGAYGALLGLGPSPFAKDQLKGINDSFNSDAAKWLKNNPGKTDADFAKTALAQGYNDKLIKFYQNNPDQVSGGIEQAKAQIGDDKYGTAAADRLAELQKIAPLTPQQAQANALSQTPGYQFALDQGLKATQNGFAAQGLASSGAAMKGAATFAEGLASQTYNAQLQNYLGNYNANLNNLNSQTNNANNIYNATSNNALNNFTNQSNLAGTSYGQGFTNALNANQQQFNNANTGYTTQTNLGTNLLNLGANAAAQTGNVGTSTASAAGGYLTSGAAAQAGGIVGSANALNNGLIQGTNNIASTATLYGLNPGLFSGGAGAAANPVINT